MTRIKKPDVLKRDTFLETDTLFVCRHYDYEIAGGDYIAIAINRNDKTDVHYFTGITLEEDDIQMTALERAVAWAYPGF